MQAAKAGSGKVEIRSGGRLIESPPAANFVGAWRFGERCHREQNDRNIFYICCNYGGSANRVQQSIIRRTIVAVVAYIAMIFTDNNNYYNYYIIYSSYS